MLTKKITKITATFVCENCDYMCSKKSYWDRHIVTAKHQRLTSVNTLLSPIKSIYNCNICNKKYNSRVGLWKHTKNCNIINPNNINANNINESIIDSSNNEIKILTHLVLEVVKNNTELQKQNQDFQKQVLDVCQKIQPSTINHNTTTTNNNNKTFNLQFFLNEQCKDAMNVSEFVNSFQLKLEDLERVGRHGYVDGISHIILSKLKETDIYKRPFHCSDAKRETLYVKDANGWEREGAENSKMIKAVKDVGQKNFTILNNYRTLHPECLQADSEYNDKYVQMMIHAAGSQKDNVNKVIKKIAKEVVIGKK